MPIPISNNNKPASHQKKAKVKSKEKKSVLENLLIRSKN